jgi:hypothetical protein
MGSHDPFSLLLPDDQPCRVETDSARGEPRPTPLHTLHRLFMPLSSLTYWDHATRSPDASESTWIPTEAICREVRARASPLVSS